MPTTRRVCVIGAGTAGVCALKHSLQHGLDAVAYEQCDEVGGTWVYKELPECERDKAQVHTSMYKGLRTNLPKEIMGFPDFLYPDSISESFVSSAEVLKFLQSYTEHFKLKAYIRFQHEVQRVRPSNDAWEVTVMNKQTGEVIVTQFDYVFVCNGHYSHPVCPEFPGRDLFKGKQMHSHLYRKPAEFKGERVLVIGSGPSGLDITNQLRSVAETVFLSHHLDPKPDTTFMSNVTQKSDVERFTELGAIFKDGSEEHFTWIIYCTGYKYAFPCFRSSEVGLYVDDNWVHPLYKHCININQPRMALIGIPFNVCPTQVFDLQVRFALKFFTGQRKLPSKEEMLADLDRDMEQRRADGLTRKNAHKMGERQFDYYRELSELADIDNIKPVIGKIMKSCGQNYLYDIQNYRRNCFKVIDDEHFVKYTPTKP